MYPSDPVQWRKIIQAMENDPDTSDIIIGVLGAIATFATGGKIAALRSIRSKKAVKSAKTIINNIKYQSQRFMRN